MFTLSVQYIHMYVCMYIISLTGCTINSDECFSLLGLKPVMFSCRPTSASIKCGKLNEIGKP